MLKTWRFFSVVIAVMIFTSGCGVNARAYVARRERVDQDVQYYPGGAANETPAPKKTRQVFVVEVTRDKKEAQASEGDPAQGVETQSSRVQEIMPSQERTSVETRRTTTPQSSMVQRSPASVVQEKMNEPMTYTVQKDDTLQKIAKQFLGSYGDWIKIYEANRDKIKDPNFLKTGTVLTIPKH